MKHELKVQRPFFDHLEGGKNFEVRRDDRGYQKGDVLLLSEWEPTQGWPAGRYTGRSMSRVVTYVYRGGFGCDLSPFVVLGLCPVGENPEGIKEPKDTP